MAAPSTDPLVQHASFTGHAIAISRAQNGRAVALKAIFVLGVMTLTSGLLLIVLGITSFVKYHHTVIVDRWFFWVPGYGLACFFGLWLVVNGSVAIAAGKKRNESLALMTISFSIISSLVCAAAAAIFSVAAVGYKYPGDRSYARCYEEKYKNCSQRITEDARLFSIVFAVTAVVSFLEFIISIVAAVFTCKSLENCCVCCSCCRAEPAKDATCQSGNHALMFTVSDRAEHPLQLVTVQKTPFEGGFSNLVP